MTARNKAKPMPHMKIAKGVAIICDSDPITQKPLPKGWTGLCTGHHPTNGFWYIGNDKGTRVFVCLKARSEDDARSEAQAYVELERNIDCAAEFKFLEQTFSVTELIREAVCALSHLEGLQKAKLTLALRAFERTVVSTAWGFEDLEEMDSDEPCPDNPDDFMPLDLTDAEKIAVLNSLVGDSSCTDEEWSTLRLLALEVRAARGQQGEAIDSTPVHDQEAIHAN